jgi:hypothetical protein
MLQLNPSEDLFIMLQLNLTVRRPCKHVTAEPVRRTYYHVIAEPVRRPCYHVTAEPVRRPCYHVTAEPNCQLNLLSEGRNKVCALNKKFGATAVSK